MLSKNFHIHIFPKHGNQKVIDQCVDSNQKGNVQMQNKMLHLDLVYLMHNYYYLIIRSKNHLHYNSNWLQHYLAYFSNLKT